MPQGRSAGTLARGNLRAKSGDRVQYEVTRAGAPALHELKRVQIRKQIFNLLLRHNLAETFHFCPSVLHDVSHALVVCGQSALGQVLPLEDAFQTRAFFAAGRVRFMATVAIVVIDFSARGLLRVEAEFGIGLAALDIAASEGDQRKHRDAGPGTRRNPVREVHDDGGRGRIIRKAWSLRSNAFTRLLLRRTECACWSIACGRAG